MRRPCARRSASALSKDPGADYQNPQFSPDGKYVAMITRRSGMPQEVLIRSLSGDEVRRFPLLLARVGLGAQWIPGSQALALTVLDSTFNQDLVRLDLVSGVQSVLAKQGGVSAVASSPDGGTIYYYAAHARNDSVAARVVAREIAAGTERACITAPRGWGLDRQCGLPPERDEMGDRSAGGERGRLFDLYNTDQYAVDKGLYHTQLHFEIGN